MPNYGTFPWKALSKLVNSKNAGTPIERGTIMKRIIILLLAVSFGGSMVTTSYASDWDKAGKALTVIEGLRLFSGGSIDVIGGFGEAVTGRKYTNRDSYVYYEPARRQIRRHRPHKKIVKHYYCTQERIWIPEYRWIKRHVPQHEEIHPEYGSVIVDEHYIRIKEEHGGHWEYQENCR